MEISDYQQSARDTDQRRGTSVEDVAVHLLGLAGEAGSVTTEYKKLLRDGEAHLAWKARLREELGDVLWYSATLATHLGLDLDDIARANLEKTADRWQRTSRDPFDDQYPAEERLPVHARFEFEATTLHGRPAARLRWIDHDRLVGDPLTDASHVDDGYRFHDVLHLAHAAVLGWSPVTRKLLGRKRRSDARVDEAEDGGRAIVIEEGVAAYVFAYASNHDYLSNIERLDYPLLDTVRTLVAPFEVSARTAADWERAILTGYRAWRELLAHNGGRVILNSENQTLTFEPAET